MWVKRAPIPVGVVVACSLVFSSCTAAPDDSSAEAAVTRYAEAFARQDAGTAASLTTAPGQADAALTRTLEAMGAERVDVDVDNPVEYSDGTASFSLTTTWTWGSDRTFESVSNGTARHLSSGWKVTWEPALIHPGLSTDATLRKIRTDATPAPRVLSRSGKTFLHLQPVNEIVLDPTKTDDLRRSVKRLAEVIAPIAPLITAEVIEDKLAESPGGPIIAVTLRDPDMEVLRTDPNRVDGVHVNKTGMLVTADRRLSSPLQEGLTNYWQAIRDATSGWQVQIAEPGARPQRLVGEQGPAGPNVKTSVDQNLQLTLGDAAVEVGQPATILVLDAATGALRGMARNSYAGERGIDIDTAYPVGSVLDPVLSAVDAADGDREIHLDRLGLGVGFTVPGASTSGGPRPGVATIDHGQESTKVSMMNMGALGVALARAAAGDPTSVAPHIIAGVQTKVDDGALGEISPALTRPVLKHMAATAKSGDASDLRGAPGLRALVGTNGPQGPGWFVGVQDGKVIVIYTEGERSGTAALQVAQKYFTIR